MDIMCIVSEFQKGIDQDRLRLYKAVLAEQIDSLGRIDNLIGSYPAEAPVTE